MVIPYLNRNPRKTFTFWVLLSALFWGGFSCTDEMGGNGKALVNLRLIDAPGDFDEAWVEILGVEILQGRSRTSSEANWIFIEYQPANQQVDISKLVGDGVLLLGRAEIPEGTISKIRLILGQDHYLVRNGERRSLNLAPGESEVELDVDYALENSFSYDIYLDFDLDRSVKPTSDPLEFNLFPKVRTFVRQGTSEISGRIRPPEARPVLYAIQGSDSLSTLTNSLGEYTFLGLKGGRHTLRILARSPFIDTVFQVETEEGKLITIEDIFLKAPALE